MTPEGSPTFRRDALARAAAAVAALAAAGAIAFPLAAHFSSLDAKTVRPVTPPRAASPTPAPVSMLDVGRSALTRVVTVETDKPAQESLGTAWLFDDKGDFVTNAHVVAGALSVRLTDRSANTYVAHVIGSDQASDIAVLRAAGGFAAQPFAARSSPLAQLPLPVVDVASSRATGHDDITVTSLTQTSQDIPLRPGEVPADGSSPAVYHDMLVLSGAHVYMGNSGGPVLDAGGQVVGILTLASPDQPDAFAIPITRVIAELRQYAGSG